MVQTGDSWSGCYTVRVRDASRCGYQMSLGDHTVGGSYCCQTPQLSSRSSHSRLTLDRYIQPRIHKPSDSEVRLNQAALLKHRQALLSQK